MIGKIPPQNTELESIVLGSILIKPDILIDIAELLNPETFYKDSHRKIYKAILSLWSDEKKIDMVTVAERLKSSKSLKSVGGAHYISTLVQRIASTTNVIEHVQILKQKEIARRQIELGNELITKGYDDSIDPLDTNSFIADEAYNLNNLIETNRDYSNRELIAEVTKKIELASTNQGITGVPTGFNKYDQITGGNQNGNLIIKAGRPGMGKTAHALCEARNASVDFGKRVLFFSLEMSATELMQRLITIHTGIEADKINKGTFTDKDWEVYNSHVSALINAPLKIIDDVQTLRGIQIKCKKENIKNGVDAIYVDYIQLINNYKKGANREQEISDISRTLKLLAKELDVPVIALSQLSRAVEQRGGDKKPMLSDLRESGAIEQDADIVTFMYRPEYYGMFEDEAGNDLRGKGYLLIAKHRGGSLKNIEMNWLPKITKFTEDEPIGQAMDYDPNKFIEPNTNFEDEIF